MAACTAATGRKLNHWSEKCRGHVSPGRSKIVETYEKGSGCLAAFFTHQTVLIRSDLSAAWQFNHSDTFRIHVKSRKKIKSIRLSNWKSESIICSERCSCGLLEIFKAPIHHHRKGGQVNLSLSFVVFAVWARRRFRARRFKNGFWCQACDGQHIPGWCSSAVPFHTAAREKGARNAPASKFNRNLI